MILQIEPDFIINLVAMTMLTTVKKIVIKHMN